MNVEGNQSTPNPPANVDITKTPVINNLQTVLCVNSPVISTPVNRIEHNLLQDSPVSQTPLNDKTETVEETLCENPPPHQIQINAEQEEKEEEEEKAMENKEIKNDDDDDDDDDMDTNDNLLVESQPQKFTQILAEAPGQKNYFTVFQNCIFIILSSPLCLSSFCALIFKTSISPGTPPHPTNPGIRLVLK